MAFVYPERSLGGHFPRRLRQAALKLSTRVCSSYSEGVVVWAQCTPGQLTRYMVEKPDGERFWALREELKTR